VLAELILLLDQIRYWPQLPALVVVAVAEIAVLGKTEVRAEDLGEIVGQVLLLVTLLVDKDIVVVVLRARHGPVARVVVVLVV